MLFVEEVEDLFKILNLVFSKAIQLLLFVEFLCLLLLLETLRRLCVRKGRPLLLCHHFFVVLLLLLLRDGLIVFLDESLGVLFLTKKWIE